MSAAAHTPLPWKVDADEFCIGVLGPDGYTVCDCNIIALRKGAPTEERLRANAKFIVRACNVHHDLIAALRTARVKVYNAAQFAGNNDEYSTLACRVIDDALAKAGVSR